MGSSFSIICKKCGQKSGVNQGGGFTFHELRCDACGRNREVQFTELGEIHIRYVKGLPGPYCIATSETDKRIQEEYPGEPLSESEYNKAVEAILEKCRCGGSFKFDSPIRCEHCRSTEFDIDPEGCGSLYD